MDFKEQYKADAESLKGTRHEAWEVWEWRPANPWAGYWVVCDSLNDPCFDNDMAEYRRSLNADQLILQWQYEADLAVNPKAYRDWLENRRLIVNRIEWESCKFPIEDINNLIYRRSPSAPDRDEWANDVWMGMKTYL